MSNPIIKAKLQERRENYELKRLRALLNERNQQLQTVEQQLDNSQTNYKHSQRNMGLFMALCVVLVLALIFGGAPWIG